MLISFILLFLFYLSLLYKDIVLTVSIESLTLWSSIIFPTMFFSFIITDLISKSDLSKYISKKLFKFFRNVFHINYEKSVFIILMSLLVGNPGGSRMVKNALNDSEIDNIEAEYLLKFTSFMSPMFLIIFVSTLFNKISLSIIFIFCHYLSSFVVMYIYHFKYQKREVIQMNKIEKTNYPKEFVGSISKNMVVILNILGVIVIFNVFFAILNELFYFPTNVNIVVSSLLEVLSGTNKLMNVDMSIIMKGLLSSIFLSFGGISIHFQILSINENMKYLSFFIFKIIISAVSGIMFFLMFLLI